MVVFWSNFYLTGGWFYITLSVIESFANKTARDVWEKEWSRSLSTVLVMRAKALMTIMHNTTDLIDLVIKG